VIANPRSISVLDDDIIVFFIKDTRLHNTSKKNNTLVCVLRII